jgi:hypothetical protein
MVVLTVAAGKAVAAAPALGAALIPAHAAKGPVMLKAGMTAPANFLVIDTK